LSREKKTGGLLFGALQERGWGRDGEGGREEGRRVDEGGEGAVRREEDGGVALCWIVSLGSSATTALVALARVMPRAYMTGPTSASFAGEIFQEICFCFNFRV